MLFGIFLDKTILWWIIWFKGALCDGQTHLGMLQNQKTHLKIVFSKTSRQLLRCRHLQVLRKQDWDHPWSPHRTEPVVANFQTQHPSETRRHILCRLKNGLNVRHFCHCDSRHSWLNIWSAPAGYFRNNRKATCSPGRRLTGPIHPVIWHSVWSAQPQGGEKGLDHA